MKVSKTDGGYLVDGRKLSSVTTILHNTLPNNELNGWKSRNSNHKEISRKAALLGSLMHLRILNQLSMAPLEIDKYLPFDEWPPDADKRMEARENQFLNLGLEFKKPLLIEQIVYHLNDPGYAGTLDICGKIEQRTTIADLKSTRKPIESHELQIAAYAAAIESMGMVKRVDWGMVIYVREDSAEITELNRHELLSRRDEFMQLAEQYNNREKS